MWVMRNEKVKGVSEGESIDESEAESKDESKGESRRGVQFSRCSI